MKENDYKAFFHVEKLFSFLNNNDLLYIKTINAIKCSLCNKEDLTEIFYPSLISITKEDINNLNLNECILKFRKPNFSICPFCNYIKSQLIYLQY